MPRLNTLLCPILLLLTFSVDAQEVDTFNLPGEWKKDFVITLSYHSSMSGGKTEIRLTYDSCIYFSQQSHSKKPKTCTYKMKEADRAWILQKLSELKIDRVKSESSVHAVHDGWSQTICFNLHCLDGGTSAEMTEHDKNVFLDAYRYLEDFASKKAR